MELEMSEEYQNLPYLYWTPKLHKSRYKHRFIVGCSTLQKTCHATCHEGSIGEILQH